MGTFALIRPFARSTTPARKCLLPKHRTRDDRLLVCTAGSVVVLLPGPTAHRCSIPEHVLKNGGDFHGSFLSDGKRFVVGTRAGEILHFSSSFELVFSGSAGQSPITRIMPHTLSDCFLYRQTETLIRLARFGEDSSSGVRFYDPVNRTKWVDFSYTSNGFFVLAVSFIKGQHSSVFAWDPDGRFYRSMDGGSGVPHERIGVIQSIPKSSDFITISSDTGNIAVWSSPVNPDWAAYIPHFTPIEENEEYSEQETEFDIDPQTGKPIVSAIPLLEETEDQDCVVDIVSKGVANACDQSFLFLPVSSLSDAEEQDYTTAKATISLLLQ